MALGFRFDPVKCVLEKGNDWDRFRLLVVADLREHPFVREYTRKIERLQNMDGGFPKEPGKPSSVYYTVEVLKWLVQLGMGINSPSISKVVDFLWRKQRVDGSWCENSEIKLEKWMTWISTEHGMPFLTSDIVEVFYDLGYEKDPRIVKAIQYIKDTQRPDGNWPAHDDQKHPDEDASCVPALVKVGEADSMHVKRGIDAMLRLLREEGVGNANEAYHLHKVWPVLIEAGYRLESEILEKRINRLKEIQREDGGWKFYWSEDSDPRYSTNILIDLVRTGIISRIDLRKAIQDIISDPHF